MIIPDPKVKRGDKVKLRIAGKPEGIVKSIAYEDQFGSFYWRYTVQCRAKNGNVYNRTVTDLMLDSIEMSKLLENKP